MGDEYIKRRDVLIKLEIAYDMARLDQKLPISDLQPEVNLIKAVDVQPIKHGRWLGDEVIQCSNCNFTLNGASFGRIVHKYFDYCPNCGARMDGEYNE